MNVFVNKINAFMRLVFGGVGTVMIFVASYNVWARDVLQVSAPWTDEALKLLDVWMIFIMAAVVFLTDEQISLTLLEDSRRVRSTPQVYHSIKLFQYILAGVLNVELVRELLKIISTQMDTGEVTTVIQYPLWLLNSGMLIGSILTVIFALVKSAVEIRNFNVMPARVA